MTISLDGFPAPYRTIPPSVHRILMMNFHATQACVNQLMAWAQDHQNYQFAHWSAAVNAASQAIEEWPGREAADGLEAAIDQDMLALVRRAGSVVQRLFELTGANGHTLGGVQYAADRDCDALVQLALQVPTYFRFSVADELPNWIMKANLPKFEDWELPLVELLVREPYLAAQRPLVLPPGSIDGSALQGGGAMLMVQTRDNNQSSALAFLEARVGTQTFSGKLIANSGNNTVVWSHEVPKASRDDTGKRQTPMQPKPLHEYLAFHVSATRQKPANTRQFDGEKRILDAATGMLAQECGTQRVGLHEVTGTLRFATTLKMCPSCYLVCTQFLVNFPAMAIEVSRL